MIGKTNLPDVTGRHDSASPVGLWPFCVALLALCVLLPFYALAPAKLSPIFAGLGGIASLAMAISLMRSGVVNLAQDAEQRRLYHEALPTCGRCDRKMPPYIASLIFTWKCPHCGEDRRRKTVKTKIPPSHSVKDKKQPFPSLDPDF
jgi:predicted RNA-binding Zn-ribbon protein involved in translation (DUF1610 family)